MADIARIEKAWNIHQLRRDRARRILQAFHSEQARDNAPAFHTFTHLLLHRIDAEVLELNSLREFISVVMQEAGFVETIRHPVIQIDENGKKRVTSIEWGVSIPKLKLRLRHNGITEPFPEE